ncbi:MAG: flagellar FliJ protein [Candidatus Latescibacterota bacterium]|jgi:flagellar FliJ protein
MKRFGFRFQRILEIKESIEDARRAELGEVMAVRNRELDQLEAMRGTLNSYRRAGPTFLAARVDAPLLGISASYNLRLEREIGEQLEHVRRIEVVVEDKRKNLLEATRERRVYEILKERAEEAHRSEVNRQQRIQLDEIGEQLYARRENERAKLDA